MPKSTEEWIRDQGLDTDPIVTSGTSATKLGLPVL